MTRRVGGGSAAEGVAEFAVGDGPYNGGDLGGTGRGGGGDERDDRGAVGVHALNSDEICLRVLPGTRKQMSDAWRARLALPVSTYLAELDPPVQEMVRDLLDIASSSPWSGRIGTVPGPSEGADHQTHGGGRQEPAHGGRRPSRARPP